MAKDKLAVKRETALASYDEELAQYAQQASDSEKAPAGSFISLKAGILSVAGAPQKGNQLECIILDNVYENALYEGKYDPNNPQPPVCYAFAREETDLKPHEESAKPQHDQCEGCPHNAWGSADEGKGKSCKNVRRLALIPVGDAGAIKDAEVFYLKVPVTSVKGWAYYVKALAAATRRPPFAVVTTVSVQPDPKTQFKVVFTPGSPLDNSQVGAVLERRKLLADGIMFPYQKPSDEQSQQPAKGKRKF